MSAAMAAQQKHHRYMIFGKKQRYIEVFQCSGEDMHLVIAGGIPTGGPVSPAKAAAAASTLLSPGTLAYPPPGAAHNPHPAHAHGGHGGTGVLGHPPHASLQIPPSQVLAWDQSLFPGVAGVPGVTTAQQHMLVQAQMQQALRQQQAQQENLWLNTLAAAQQAQQQHLAAALAAVNVSGAKGWDGSLGGSLGAAQGASQRALIPISAVSSASPATSSGNASFSLANSNSLPQSVSSKGVSMPMSYYPGVGGGVGAHPAQSVYLFNATQASQASRMPQYHPKVPPPNASVHGSASSNAGQSPLSPLVQPPAGSNAALMAGMGTMGTMGMKRSWENAFPTDSTQLPLKRQWQSSQSPQASAAALSYMQSLPPYQAQFYPTM